VSIYSQQDVPVSAGVGPPGRLTLVERCARDCPRIIHHALLLAGRGHHDAIVRGNTGSVDRNVEVFVRKGSPPRQSIAAATEEEQDP